MDNIWNKLKEIADSNNSFIKTCDVEAAGISRPIKNYFNSNADKRKLLKYSKALGVEEAVRTYTEVL